MVQIADINDRYSLENWLKEKDLRCDLCVALTFRAIMRVFPIPWLRQIRNGKQVMPHLRVTLLLAVAGFRQNCVVDRLKFERALRSAARETARLDGAERGDDDLEAGFVLSMVRVDGDYAESNAARIARISTLRNEDINESGVLWTQIRSDCEWLDRGQSLEESPLFVYDQPDSFSSLYREIEATAGGPEWHFWTDWYERALAGEPQPWPLLLEIALKEDAFWQGSDDEVMARINEIVEDYEDRRLDQIRERIADQSETNLGSEAELAARKLVFEQIKALLESLPSASSGVGIGHNQPPDEFALDDEQIAELSANTLELKHELEKPVPNLEVAVEKTSQLRKIIGWAAEKAELTITEFCKGFGSSLGKTAGRTIPAVLVAYPFWGDIVGLFQATVAWLSIVVGI